MTKFSNTSIIKREISKLKRSGLYNDIKIIDSPIDAKIKVNGKWVLNFCSNNYLGLANHSRIKKAAKKAIDKYGVGPAAVRTIAGTTKIHIELEKRLAKFKHTEDVITFQSGFNANTAVIPALIGKGDVIFSDELNHASIIDGCRLSGAEVIQYEHANPDDLEIKIKKIKSSKQKMIITDGVFSMDGDIAPLDKIHPLSEKYKALLIVDDAHGEGVLGKGGRGIADHFNLSGKINLEIGTLSKAFGVVGGYAAGKKDLIEWLEQRARPFLFSSAMTIPDVGAAIEAVTILEKSENLVEQLWENTNYFKIEMMNQGYDIGKSVTPIVPVMLGNEKITRMFSKRLFEKGVFAKAIAYPTVPKGKARIRVMMSASHSIRDLDKALEEFNKVGRKFKIIN